MSASSTPSSCTLVPEKSTPSVGVAESSPSNATLPALSSAVAKSPVSAAMSSTAISSTSMPRPQLGPPYQPPESKPYGPTRSAASVRRCVSRVSQSVKPERPEVKTTSSPLMSTTTSPSSLRWIDASGSVSPAFEAPSSLQAVASRVQLRKRNRSLRTIISGSQGCW